jgi:membrane-associated phospholipid phosphatase
VLVVSIICAALFAVLTWSVAADWGLALADPRVHDFVVQHRVGWLTDTFRALTWLGSAPVLALVVVTFGAVMVWRRGTWLEWAVLTAAWLLTVLAKNWAKALIERPRPPASSAIGSSTGFSFPSGHAADSLAVFAMIAVILSVGFGRRMGLFARIGAVALISIVGASRVYLGVHWLTDVLGGWALAGAIAWAVSVPLRFERSPPRTTERLRPPAGPARTSSCPPGLDR